MNSHLMPRSVRSRAALVTASCYSAAVCIGATSASSKRFVNFGDFGSRGPVPEVTESPKEPEGVTPFALAVALGGFGYLFWDIFLKEKKPADS